ncbi:MAG: protein kinase [Xanthomonadales bacterium]|nr:protein kinase [Xanthomonadales bacterium]
MTEQIGRFHVRKRLGGGGFGEVFLAEDPTIGRQVAIKVFRPKDENLIAFATSSNTEGLDILRTRFLNEAKILAKLHDEAHVVDVLDFGEMPDGTPYYVMPYLPNSLAQELGKDVFDVNALAELDAAERPRALPMEQALDAVEQTLKGLAAAHAHGLVHRDIKPGNLMRSEKGLVRIVDFGIAKAPDGQHSTVSHLGMGSRNYMAPEQRESAKHVDARADVYSTGVVAYRALTGKLPVGRFADPNVAIPALGAPMNCVLLKMLAQDKSERPKDANEALALFQQARKSVGKQDSSEHSGTWAGDQGESSLRDELKPLKARIIAVVGATGLITQADLRSLRALAAVADLDDAGLTALITDTLAGDRSLSAKSKLGQLIRDEVGKQGRALSAEILEGFHAAGEAVGWDAEQLRKIMQAAVADLPKARPGTAGNLQPVSPAASVAGSAAPGTGSSAGPRPGLKPDAPKPAAPAAAKPRSKLPAAIAAILVLGGAGYSVYEWRQTQIAAEQRERALSAATESEAAAWQQATQTDSGQAYADYLKLWPESSNAGEAKTRQNQLEEQVRLAQLSETQREQERIKGIQRDLNALGYRVEENGEADTRTAEAIKKFEREQKLVVSGAADNVLANALKDELIRRDDAAWAAASRADTVVAYVDYKARFPGGRHAGSTERKIAEVRHRQAAIDEAARIALEEREAEEASEAERARLVAERRRAEEDRRDEDAAWAAATSQNTEVAYEAYRMKYPTGRYLEQVPARLEAAMRPTPDPVQRGREEGQKQASESVSAVGETARFTVKSAQVLVDALQKIDWVRQDSKSAKSWPSAQSYCSSLGVDGGGWRAAKLTELQGLYNQGENVGTKCGWTRKCNISSHFELSRMLIWGSVPGSPSGKIFDFEEGIVWQEAAMGFNPRAMCVRDRTP